MGGPGRVLPGACEQTSSGLLRPTSQALTHQAFPPVADSQSTNPVDTRALVRRIPPRLLPIRLHPIANVDNPVNSWLPLLFIPTNASPAFIFLFFICTWFLNRPCVYCSILLLILFLTSCNWSDRCFFDFSSNWFQPRPSLAGGSSPDGSLDTALLDHQEGHASLNASVVDMVNSTARALASAAADEITTRRKEWTGLGIEWLRNLLGKREWRIECMDIYIRL
ncbi:hypothetical protein HJFPF1_04707 [Paramyrothecium foliicola]|nr:hypothetical protein HJFPF1_04707 [Paramyrothecium foliicola]